MNAALYTFTVFAWGASWLAVKYQLGVVAPEASLVYRFALSAVIMFALCLATGRSLRFGLRAHGRLALLGLLLFSTNYYLIYLATRDMTSGLVAVGFSAVTVLNIVNGALFMGVPVRPRAVLGAATGIAGIGLVFWPEIAGFDLGGRGLAALGLCLAGTFSASLGMVTSGVNQRRGLPVVQGNAWGMAYGAVFMGAMTLAGGTTFDFDPRPLYVGSLAFLVVISTVIGFWCYLTLLGRIGPDRAGYATVLFPIVALALSTLFEGYAWTPPAILGLALVLAGNVLVLTGGGARRAEKQPKTAAEPGKV
ncbi:MAG: EamA family transporter [Hyphomicrobiales bacterium]|nr:EamA family transporter [Hyphomicrobiales bacterium]